ncbi:MAG: hypothetical protein MUO40_10440, partial [Anaerolineaceae bacterium]|nr:hypothetical protein [Anaerolineaceae bacterium]
MNKTFKNLGLFLYIAFFLVGITIRFAQLGADPLSQNESLFALQAFEGLNGRITGTIDQSSYFGLTILSFFLTYSSDFVARFWPALAGSLLIFTPLLWRKEFGQVTTLGLVFALAIDPVFVHASRIIGSPIIAIIGLIAGLSLLYHKKATLSGITLAIALLGGESFWFGAVVLSITWGVIKLINKRAIDVESNIKFRLKELGFDQKQIFSGI